MDKSSNKMKGVAVRLVGVVCIALLAVVLINISRKLFSLPVPPTNFASDAEYFSAWVSYLACQLLTLTFGLLVSFGVMRFFAKLAIKFEQEHSESKSK